MANHEIETNNYSEDLRILQTSDPAHADMFNPLFKQLINNDAFMKALIKRMIKEHNHNGTDEGGAKIPFANIDVPVNQGGIVTATQLQAHINARNPHGTRAVDVAAASEQDFTGHLAAEASLAKEGHVRLSNSTNSTSDTEAATPSAVKQAYDKAVSVGNSAPKIASGNYIGNSVNNQGDPGRKISIGFTPKLVYISTLGRTSNDQIVGLVGYDGTASAIADAYSNASKVEAVNGMYQESIEITDNGFIVFGHSMNFSGFNLGSYNYGWVAIG